jgi:hypothetical protein
MSLLVDFIVAINDNWIALLRPALLRGKEQEVLDLFLWQRQRGAVDKDAVQQQLGLSNSHFDKICSVLLNKCYQQLAPDGELSLLTMLSAKVPALERHFFKEAMAQVEQHKKDCGYLCSLLELMQNNLPVASQKLDFFHQVSQQVHLAVSPKDLASVKIYTAAKELYLRIAIDFASRKMEETATSHEAVLMKLEEKFDLHNAQAQAEVLRTRVYFHFACMQMEACIAPALAALTIYQTGKFVYAQENYQRMQLRLAEIHYLRSDFAEALAVFRNAFSVEDDVPDRGYYNTKYIQLCLIEGAIAEAQMRFDAQIQNIASPSLYPIRDILSGIKVFLFAGELEKVQGLLQLGFAAQSKTRYMQYEIELRNLEVAYFYLSKDADVALQLCERNVKYLHKNGFNTKKSRYPEFFLLTKAFIRKRKLTLRQQQLLNDWQTEGYALYGRLLQRMYAA